MKTTGFLGMIKKFKKDIKFIHYNSTKKSYTIEWKSGERDEEYISREDIYEQVVNTGLLWLPF